MKQHFDAIKKNLKKENDQKKCQFALRQQLKTNDQGKI